MYACALCVSGFDSPFSFTVCHNYCIHREVGRVLLAVERTWRQVEGDQSQHILGFAPPRVHRASVIERIMGILRQYR